jgi:NADPH:quinone reductase-like Zn-dependent oxidoreductase
MADDASVAIDAPSVREGRSARVDVNGARISSKVRSSRRRRLVTAVSACALLCHGAGIAQTPDATSAARIKTVVQREYGSPDILRIEEIPKPVPKDDQVLVHVRAASINPYDWHCMRGEPYIMRAGFGLFVPADTRFGVDCAGTIEAVGANVKRFHPGDEVFGGITGSLAEYVCAREEGSLAIKPAVVTFEQAAALPIAAVTALQALRDKGQVRAGQRVLINGASGGVGTFAVQIAKSFGAVVTGVCSTKNVELVRSLGADEVIDYTREDFTEGTRRYDLLLDCVGNHSLSECRRVLEPEGMYVMIGGPAGRWIRPLNTAIAASVMSKFVSQRMVMIFAGMNREDLALLGDMMQSGVVKPVIDRRYEFGQIADAVRYLEEGHARGKVIIDMEHAHDAPVAGEPVVSSFASMAPFVIPLVLLIVFVGLPIAAAIALNRRFQSRHPGAKPFRWGYCFSIQACMLGILLGVVLEFGVLTAIVVGLVYTLLAWSFARRRRWAWITLTIVTFNPLVWIVNAIYLWKRWRENTAFRSAEAA